MAKLPSAYGFSVKPGKIPSQIPSANVMLSMALSAAMQEKYLTDLQNRARLMMLPNPVLPPHPPPPPAGLSVSALPGYMAALQSYLPSSQLMSREQHAVANQWILNSPDNSILSRSAIQHFRYPDVIHAQKPKRIRTAFSPSQLIELENAFERNKYLVGQERRALASRLGLSETQVKVWFQNRRTKVKRRAPDAEDEDVMS